MANDVKKAVQDLVEYYEGFSAVPGKVLLPQGLAQNLQNLHTAVRASETPEAAKFRAMARGRYATNEVEIDEDAAVSPSADGAFVQAWVWVEN